MFVINAIIQRPISYVLLRNVISFSKNIKLGFKSWIPYTIYIGTRVSKDNFSATLYSRATNQISYD